jgi:lipopolysaccharide/colanic/teichoic acid biosynthesis glycosyltransferase
MLKRLFDVTAASAGLLVLSPVIAVIALVIRRSIGSPVLFRQVRPGLHGRPFTMVKFRTMRDATDEKGNPLPDDQRMTRVGSILRSTSLDELPELWNVVKGEMSLVGPRPLLMQYLDRYTPEQMRRHEARPGVTGWAQINGRNAIGWDARLAMDVWYVDNRTFLLDIKIIALTLLKVFKRDGVAADGHVTMPEFMGSEHT